MIFRETISPAAGENIVNDGFGREHACTGEQSRCNGVRIIALLTMLLAGSPSSAITLNGTEYIQEYQYSFSASEQIQFVDDQLLSLFVDGRPLDQLGPIQLSYPRHIIPLNTVIQMDISNWTTNWEFSSAPTLEDGSLASLTLLAGMTLSNREPTYPGDRPSSGLAERMFATHGSLPSTLYCPSTNGCTTTANFYLSPPTRSATIPIVEDALVSKYNQFVPFFEVDSANYFGAVAATIEVEGELRVYRNGVKLSIAETQALTSALQRADIYGGAADEIASRSQILAYAKIGAAGLINGTDAAIAEVIEQLGIASIGQGSGAVLNAIGERSYANLSSIVASSAADCISTAGGGCPLAIGELMFRALQSYNIELAQDPPRDDFSVVEGMSGNGEQLFAAAGFDGATASYLGGMLDLVEAHNAALLALERYQGADAAGEMIAAGEQYAAFVAALERIEEVSNLVGPLQSAFFSEVEAADAAFLSEVAGAGIDPNQFYYGSLFNEVRAGLADEAAYFLSIVSDNYVDLPTDLEGRIQNVVGAANEANDASANLGVNQYFSDFLAIRDGDFEPPSPLGAGLFDEVSPFSDGEYQIGSQVVPPEPKPQPSPVPVPAGGMLLFSAIAVWFGLSKRLKRKDGIAQNVVP